MYIVYFTPLSFLHLIVLPLPNPSILKSMSFRCIKQKHIGLQITRTPTTERHTMIYIKNTKESLWKFSII